MKYELTDLSIEHKGYTLYRIRALKGFGQVKKGDLGGYIESEKNLSQDGDAWVIHDAKVYGRAWVSNNALIAKNAEVFGRARVYDNACVSGQAKVFGNARVLSTARAFERAQVYGRAVIHGHAVVYGYSEIYGDAVVHGHASISGESRVYGDSEIYSGARISVSADIGSKRSVVWFSVVGSENGTLTAFKTKEGVRVSRGCYHGTLEDFEFKVGITHENSIFQQEYQHLINYIKFRFELID